MTATDVLAVTCEIGDCQYDERWLIQATCTGCGQEVRLLTCRTHGAELKAGQILCQCGAPLGHAEMM